MNLEHDELPTEPSDESIKEILAPLKELQLSLEKQTEIRQLVNSRLTESADKHTGSSTVRNLTARSLTALVCTMLIGIGIGWILRGMDHKIDVVTTGNTNDHGSETREVNSNDNESKLIVETNDLQPSYYVSEIYLCGVGTLSTSSGHVFQEDN